MGMEFLLKQLGINPEEIKQSALEFGSLAKTMQQRISAIEATVNAIAEKLGVEIPAMPATQIEKE